MALTITGISPSTGLTGGREMIVIQGTDFNVDVDSDAVSLMEVYFGTEQATRVRVRSTTELDCLTPIHDPGTVDVKVKDTVGPVEVTETDGFTYDRPVIGGTANDSDLWRVVRTLAVELRRQVLEEVVLGPEVDYSDTPGGSFRVTKLAKTPAIVLDGPRIFGATSSQFRGAEEPWTEVSAGVFKRLRPQSYVNLTFTLFGVDKKKIRVLNLQKAIIEFFRRNEVLRVLKDPTQPALGNVEIDMRPPRPQGWLLTMTGNKSSLKFFSGEFTLFGVPIGYDDYIEETRALDEFDFTFEQKT